MSKVSSENYLQVEFKPDEQVIVIGLGNGDAMIFTDMANPAIFASLGPVMRKVWATRFRAFADMIEDAPEPRLIP